MPVDPALRKRALGNPALKAMRDAASKLPNAGKPTPIQGKPSIPRLQEESTPYHAPNAKPQITLKRIRLSRVYPGKVGNTLYRISGDFVYFPFGARDSTTLKRAIGTDKHGRKFVVGPNSAQFLVIDRDGILRLEYYVE